MTSARVAPPPGRPPRANPRAGSPVPGPRDSPRRPRPPRRTGTVEAFAPQGDGGGWCRRPVRLRGSVTVGAVGRRRTVFSAPSRPGGMVLRPCSSRREPLCPSCAAVSRDAARHLVRAGLVGGKGVDEAVTVHPAVLLTLTAPGFGAVHAVRDEKPCRRAPASTSARCAHGRSLGCRSVHRECDGLVGTPLCPDCYDYDGAVLHNASTSEQWRRTTIYIQRQLAAVLGLTRAETRRVVRLSFCRVAEYQRRGAAHLHAVVRADHPDGGPAPGPPALSPDAAATAPTVPARG